jgi:hypothetical protein
MEHADVREQLELEGLEPARLEALLQGRGEALLVRHLAECAACRAEGEALRTTTRLLALAAPDDLRAPRGARERLLARARESRPEAAAAGAGAAAAGAAAEGRPREPARPRRRATVLAGLATAAAILVVAGAALVTTDLARQRDAAAQQAAGLGRVAATTDELLRDPNHRRAVLTDATSQPSGSVLVSGTTGQLVVVSKRLPDAPTGQRYGCFMEREGRFMRIGFMAATDDLAFWIGSVGDMPDPGREGDRFVISLQEDGSSPILAGDF